MANISDDKTEEIIGLLYSLVSYQESLGKVHEKEHESLRVLIEEHRDKKDLSVSLKKKVVGGTVWGMMLAIAYTSAFAFKKWIGMD